MDILRFISYVACVRTVYTNIIFCLDGYVIGHYANNARDFLYPAVPPYPGSGRELTLFKTSLFNPIRITVSIKQFRWEKSKTTYLQPSFIKASKASLFHYKIWGIHEHEQTTTLHIYHSFLYISLPLLHKYNVKIPNFMFQFSFLHFYIVL